jgi:hypothetical protein
VLQGAAQAELQAPQAVGQQAAAALQQFEVGQQVLQPLPQPWPQASQEAQALPQPAPQAPQGAAQLPQPAPQPVPHPPQGAAQLAPHGAAQLGAGQQWFAPQQPRRRRPASASLVVKAINRAARADKANSLRIMMCDS